MLNQSVERFRLATPKEDVKNLNSPIFLREVVVAVAVMVVALAGVNM